MLRETRVYLMVAALVFFHLPKLPTLNATTTSTSASSDGILGNNDVVFYFAFGSNMLAKRILIMNPTSIVLGAAALENYRLDFDQLNPNWRGARATILPAENKTVFGVLWTIDQRDVENLDRQEGVSEGIYAPMDVSVNLLFNNTVIPARTYSLAAGIPEDSKFDRRPSKTYLKCIVKGAQENKLPVDYIHYLQSIEDNGVTAPILEEMLDLQDFQIKA